MTITYRSLFVALIGGMFFSFNSQAQQEHKPESPAKLSTSETKSSQASSEKQLVVIGQALFHDTRLSNPKGQSCASCHDAQRGFTDNKIVSPGAAPNRFGSRNTPSLNYAHITPRFSFSDGNIRWRGGQFWDGRVDSLSDQAIEPLLSEHEMNNTRTGLIEKLIHLGYKTQLEEIYSADELKQHNFLLKSVGQALAAFQRSEHFAKFNSKFDYYKKGLVKFSEKETKGELLFEGKASCRECHSGHWGSPPHEMFTDYTHHNIGVPVNIESPFLKNLNEQKQTIDEGLANNTRILKRDRARARGLFKTPTLRNIALTAPYMHNGVFKDLHEVVRFYNKDPVTRKEQQPPEVEENFSDVMFSPLNLSEDEIDAIVAFLQTLTDGYSLTTEEKENLKQYNLKQENSKQSASL